MTPGNTHTFPSKRGHTGKLAAFAVLVMGLAMGTGRSVSASQAAAPPATPSPSSAAAPADHPEFPQTPGRDVVLRVCSKCHSPNNMLAQGRSSQDWQDLISKMVGFGAQGSDEDFTAILDYVNTNFPPTYPKINVNKSNAAQLVSGLSLTPEEAKAVVDYRTGKGDFKTVDDLKAVPAVDPKKLDAAKAKLLF